jgi:hypothetical protein
VRVNRVEGIALGSGLGAGLGSGIAVRGDARYGLDDRILKWNGGLRWDITPFLGVEAGGGRDYRDAADIAERSIVVNSLASQEFGSDVTDLYGVSGARLSVEWRRRETMVVSASVARERHDALTVRATPASGSYRPALPVDQMSAVTRIEALLERGNAPWGESGAELAYRLGARSTLTGSDDLFLPFRLAALVEMSVPWRAARVLHSWTYAGAAVGSRVPLQDAILLGGPVSSPGYTVHSLVGSVGAAQRLEVRTPIPAPDIPLGRFGRVPGTAQLAPYVHLAQNILLLVFIEKKELLIHHMIQ